MVFKILFTLLISIPLFGSECFLNQALKNPKLRDDPHFWEEYGKLAEPAGKIPEHSLKELLRKFRVDEEVRPAVASPKVVRDVKIENKAEKEISGLPKHLKAKVDEFLSIMSSEGGVNTLLQNPGKWHHEKFKRNGQLHSVRINENYRVLFEISDQNVVIRRVNRGQIHEY